MRPLIAILCWLGVVLGPIVASAQPVPTVSAAPGVTAPGPKRTDRIEAELVPLSAWAAPGSTAVVAVRQAIKPGWHTYWRNPGDSGGATTLAWALPAGVEAGPIVWPTPERLRLQSLMNYGYSGTVFLPVPIEIPAHARPGTTLPLTVRALFLVCSAEMCVPDEMTLSLDLPIRAGAAPLDPRHGRQIRDVVETAPRPAGITARAAMVGGSLVLSAVGGPLTGATLERAWFFPHEGGVIDHAAMQSAERGPQGLTLTLTPGGTLVAAGLTGPISGVLATDAGAWEITAAPGSAPAGAIGLGALSTDEGLGASGGGVAAFLRAALFALIGGLVVNLMPCVFPILAMKAAALAGTAHDPAAARRDGLAFLAGVLTTFLTLAGALLALRAGGEAAGWGFQLQSPAVTGGLALLMLAVALNLSGVFHIGAGLQGAGAGPLARLPGGVGAFLTGVLAVAVAAPCTAPFMAVALGAALLMPWPMALTVFLALGLGLALPYVAVSLSPRLLAILPRPGPWMDRLKGLLAFPMYGAGLWLAWVFSRQTGGEALGWLFAAGLALALALWLSGMHQAARAVGGRGAVSGVGAVVALVAALGLAVAAVRSPVSEPAREAGGVLDARPWSSAAVAGALAEGRPVLVNFTADWCVTCKINERAALSTPRTEKALAASGAVYLVGDWTRRDDAITAELQRHGRSGVPLYLLYMPGQAKPRILPQLLTEGVIVEALSAPPFAP